jgi:hypothetical protein
MRTDFEIWLDEKITEMADFVPTLGVLEIFANQLKIAYSKGKTAGFEEATEKVKEMGS